MTTTVNPRLVDTFGLTFTQDDVPFAIPHLNEDIRLYLDPFLLWASPIAEYKALHARLMGFLETLGSMVRSGRESQAMEMLLKCREPRELGLGYAMGSKSGSTIGAGLARNILNLYKHVPQLQGGNLGHIEELQLLVPGIGEDRISDLTAAVLKSFLIEYTAEQAKAYGIPTKQFLVPDVYDHVNTSWIPGVRAQLPYNPVDHSPLLFAPLDMLRHLPWINYEDFYKSYFAPFVLPVDQAKIRLQKERVLNINRANYHGVQQYVLIKEANAGQCKPDPLFEPLALGTLKRKLSILEKLPTGLENQNDKKFEDVACDLLVSLLYPELDFAAQQVRTVSGVHIRDLIFYNDGKNEFLKDIRNRFDARQLVFELKNVKQLDRDHVNQLYRYLDDEFGRVGVLMTRNAAPSSVTKNTVDLHSSKRCIVLCFDDTDLRLMVDLVQSGRRPIEVFKKKFIEFTRLLPK